MSIMYLFIFLKIDSKRLENFKKCFFAVVNNAKNELQKGYFFTIFIILTIPIHLLLLSRKTFYFFQSNAVKFLQHMYSYLLFPIWRFPYIIIMYSMYSPVRIILWNYHNILRMCKAILLVIYPRSTYVYYKSIHILHDY